MDGPPISRADAVAALRARLFEPGVVAEGFAPIELSDRGGHELRLRFRWHSDGRTYIRLLPVGPADLAAGWLSGERVPADVWAGEVRLRLMEDLQTGFVREAVQRRESDGIVLVERRYGEPHRRGVYYTSDVPLLQPARTWVRRPRPPAPSDRGSFVELGGGDRDARDLEFDPLAGSRLVAAGLDVRIPRRLIAEGRLLSWKQLCEDTATAPSVGHAAAGWDPDGAGAARLEVIGTLPGLPDGAAQQLVTAVCRDAAAAGAATVVTDLVGPGTVSAGFVDLADGTGRHLDLRAG